MRNRAFVGFLLFLGLCIVQPAASQPGVFDGFVLIGNNVGSGEISIEEATSAMQGKKSVWPNGKPILVVLPNTRNESSALIARRLFATNTQGMQRYWLSQVFQGRSNAPVFLEEWGEIVRKVRDVEGSIAMVPQGTPVPSSLVLTVR